MPIFSPTRNSSRKARSFLAWFFQMFGLAAAKTEDEYIEGMKEAGIISENRRTKRTSYSFMDEYYNRGKFNQIPANFISGDRVYVNRLPMKHDAPNEIPLLINSGRPGSAVGLPALVRFGTYQPYPQLH